MRFDPFESQGVFENRCFIHFVKIPSFSHQVSYVFFVHFGATVSWTRVNLGGTVNFFPWSLSLEA